jgi:hypothetical protein
MRQPSKIVMNHWRGFRVQNRELNVNTTENREPAAVGRHSVSGGSRLRQRHVRRNLEIG